ncbi:flavin reductase family protein [Nocardiopsis alba]|uniref:flavin reductase family protein n=1 Tax=Nocardiopsis alba TaxID=53437 RepID=UPI0033C55920
MTQQSTSAHRPLDRRLFRDVLGRFATGVVLITTRTEDGPAGMVVNSFTSVSLDPPLVAFCAARTSTTWPRIRATGDFAVSILGEGHVDLCRRFGVRAADRFAGRGWTSTPAGHPVPADGLGWLDCAITVVHPAGDHELIIASTIDGAPTGPADPLVFHGSRFRVLAPEKPTSTEPMTHRRTGRPS